MYTRYGQAYIPDSEQTPVETDPLCNSKGGTTTHAPDERLPLRNKCVRRLIRPVYIWGSEGQYMVKFALDRIGIFSLDIKFRGEEPIFLDGRLNTGSRIMGGPYAIVVKPNLAKAAWTTASGAGCVRVAALSYNQSCFPFACSTYDPLLIAQNKSPHLPLEAK